MNSTCPFCLETIQQGAIKCKHCGEFLDKRAVSSSLSQPPTKLIAMSILRIIVLLVMILVILPIALFFGGLIGFIIWLLILILLALAK